MFVRRPSLAPRLLPGLCLAAALLGGCAGRTGGTRAPEVPTRAPWVEDPAVVLDTRAEIERLEALRVGGPAERLARLDRLLDLYDAARFDHGPARRRAREALWAALGGTRQSTGEDATREAARALLGLAHRIEARDLDGLDDEGREWLGDAIGLLTIDVSPVADAEELSIRALGYATLAESGHPRLRDNALWRLYDHLHGVLDGVVEHPAPRRHEIALHGLYLERESIEDHLADTAPHARPAWPGAAAIVAPFEHVRDDLAADPRWTSVLASRNEADQALVNGALLALPGPRDPSWPLPRRRQGTGRPESLAPLILARPGNATVDPGRPGAPSFAPRDAALGPALETVLNRDGRGLVVLAADRELPAPELAAVLEAMVRARTTTIEIGVHEPRLDSPEEQVLVTLPLQVARSTSSGTAAFAFSEARIQVHLDGRGPRFAIDGVWLTDRPAGEAELRALVDQLARAFPRERGVGLSIAPDVRIEQLVELLVALEGGATPSFAGVGWRPDQHPDPGEGEAAADRRLKARGALFDPAAGLPVIDQPFPLPGADQQQLEALATSLRACLPELEQAPRKPVKVALAFDQGKLASRDVEGRVPGKTRAAFEACLADVSVGTRLRKQRDPITVTVTLDLP